MPFFFAVHACVAGCGAPVRSGTSFAGCQTYEGGACSPHCDTGYVATGVLTASCGSDGLWSYGGTCTQRVSALECLTVSVTRYQCVWHPSARRRSILFLEFFWTFLFIDFFFNFFGILFLHFFGKRSKSKPSWRVGGSQAQGAHKRTPPLPLPQQAFLPTSPTTRLLLSVADTQPPPSTRCPRTPQGRELCPARREVPATGVATGP